MSTIEVLTNNWSEYELLDSGLGRKLERVGAHTLVRSEPKAWWAPELTAAQWAEAHASLAEEKQRVWHHQSGVAEQWLVTWQQLTLQLKLTAMSKHIGIFPEHSRQWQWLQETIEVRVAAGQQVRVLNLFGYTGVASLAAAAAGAMVTHVDASKVSITWARENQRLSGLETAPIRWIVDDALKFVRREVKRERVYDIILLDPPAFGRGPAGQVWKIEPDISPLLQVCRQVLSSQPLGVLLTAYTINASSLLLGNLLHDMMRGIPGDIATGELVVSPVSGVKPLSLSLYARWCTV